METTYLYDPEAGNDGEQEVYFLCPKCPVCGNQAVILLPISKVEELEKPNRRHVQDIFPHWPNEDRELLITGTHEECWNRLFAHPFLDDEADANCVQCGEPSDHPFHKEA